MIRKTAFVITTINKPTSLEEYCKQVESYNHKNVEFFVVGDKKTPSIVPGYCEDLSSKYSVPINYMDLKEQDEIIGEYDGLLDFYPYNDANRKHIGIIKAYIDGFETMIVGDDDNFATDHDFFGYHDIVGSDQELKLIESPSGWFNVCEYLIEENNMPIYHRGYPWSQRKIEKENTTIRKEKGKIMVNAGLWMDDPDVDAVSRLFWPIRAIGMQEDFSPNFGLYPGTWCPFNNQNTALDREVIPAYLTVYPTLRYSDILPSFVVCRIAEHLNHVISFGYPFSRQIRNKHNIWVDLEMEMYGAQAAEVFIDLLKSADLTKNSYHECLGELNTHFEKNRKIIENLPTKQKKMLTEFIEALNVYHYAFDTIRSNSKLSIER